MANRAHLYNTSTLSSDPYLRHERAKEPGGEFAEIAEGVYRIPVTWFLCFRPQDVQMVRLQYKQRGEDQGEPSVGEIGIPCTTVAQAITNLEAALPIYERLTGDAELAREYRGEALASLRQLPLPYLTMNPLEVLFTVDAQKASRALVAGLSADEAAIPHILELSNYNPGHPPFHPDLLREVDWGQELRRKSFRAANTIALDGGFYPPGEYFWIGPSGFGRDVPAGIALKTVPPLAEPQETAFSKLMGAVQNMLKARGAGAQAQFVLGNDERLHLNLWIKSAAEYDQLRQDPELARLIDGMLLPDVEVLCKRYRIRWGGLTFEAAKVRLPIAGAPNQATGSAAPPQSPPVAKQDPGAAKRATAVFEQLQQDLERALRDAYPEVQVGYSAVLPAGSFNLIFTTETDAQRDGLQLDGPHLTRLEPLIHEAAVASGLKLRGAQFYSRETIQRDHGGDYLRGSAGAPVVMPKAWAGHFPPPPPPNRDFLLNLSTEPQTLALVTMPGPPPAAAASRMQPSMPAAIEQQAVVLPVAPSATMPGPAPAQRRPSTSATVDQQKVGRPPTQSAWRIRALGALATILAVVIAWLTADAPEPTRFVNGRPAPGEVAPYYIFAPILLGFGLRYLIWGARGARLLGYILKPSLRSVIAAAVFAAIGELLHPAVASFVANATTGGRSTASEQAPARTPRPDSPASNNDAPRGAN